MSLPIDDVPEIDPTNFLTGQTYESLDDVATAAAAVDAAIAEKTQASDLAGALAIAGQFIKSLLIPAL